MISAGAASGKSLVIQAPTLDHLANNSNATAIYPNQGTGSGPGHPLAEYGRSQRPDPTAINRINGDMRDLTEQRQILQHTRLALIIPEVMVAFRFRWFNSAKRRRPCV